MLLFLVLFALWLLLNGRGTLELILIGAAVSGRGLALLLPHARLSAAA